MTRRTRRLRSAFSLVELLVVIAIIALLLSLLMAGVQSARESGRRTQALQEINELGEKIGVFKLQYSVKYIPSRIRLREDGAYITTGAGANQLDIDSLNWLKIAWPRLKTQVDWNQNGTIETTPIELEGDQCLVFFLGGMNENGQPSGFSTNTSNPMDPNGKRVGPFAQFQPGRLLDVHGNGFRSFIDPWKDKPYLYFTSYGKEKGVNAYTADCPKYGLSPYSDPSTNKFLQPDGFQIVSAGEDKEFGPGGANLPATGVGEDNLANFSKVMLGSGIQ